MSEQEVTCVEIEEMAAELAVGALSGAERATALGHLKGCARCRDLVDDLAGAADQLLLLTPVTEPPVGFESRVAARIGDEPQVRRLHPPRPKRRWAVAVAVAAAVMVALAGIAVGSLIQGRDTGDDVPIQAAVARSERSGAICRAVVYGEQPAWLMVSLEGVRPDVVGDYLVEAVADGSSAPIPVGAFLVRDGHGAFGTTLDMSARDVESIRVLWQGRVLYEARFS